MADCVDIFNHKITATNCLMQVNAHSFQLLRKICLKIDHRNTEDSWKGKIRDF